ncbi:hypothetical protein IFM89_009337 [Coptis chinensis]|uniref:Complex 1 LYR protein domain-containing protein n=1 Tax=Coptis chinensis TaxID=261450 RepID=A0A835HLB1_9MAGN|nr:hypothetical protein IFM89_009337 [Coptis chinensis]
MVHSLDLQAFILRSRVLKFYRQALRISGRAPTHSRGEMNKDSFVIFICLTLYKLERVSSGELRQEIRQEMEKNRECNDKQRIRFLISEGMERLKALDEMLDMQGH